MDKYHVYIMTNPKNTALHIGVTRELMRRVYQHKNKLVSGAKNSNLTRLVYLEECESITEAMKRESQIKGWSRAKKMEMIKKDNPDLEELKIPE